MAKWAEKLKEGQKHERELKVTMVAANHHYAGFGPATPKAFREMLGLTQVNWGVETRGSFAFLDIHRIYGSKAELPELAIFSCVNSSHTLIYHKSISIRY